VPKGVLIDLRPLETNWPVEIAWSDGFTEVARLTDLPEAVADDTAASRAMEEAEARGWFRREHEEFFPYFYSWDVPSEMQEFMETEWEGIEKLSEEGLRAAQSAWAVAEADARVRVRISMMIARWRKL